MALKQTLTAKISDSGKFLKTDIWRLRTDKLPRRQSFAITQLRIFLLAVRRFVEDKCALRASALTFYSLLSIVPVVALAFAVAKGFGVEKILAEKLMASLEGHEEVAERVISFAQSLLENTKGGAIAGVGIVVLFWTVVKVLGNIEASFNDIWEVKTARNFARKFADFLSVMTICPILLIAASSVTVLVITQVTAIVERLSFLGYLAQLILLLLKILPYAFVWLLFTFIYVFMPNTKVGFKSALWGGILAGTIFQVVQLAYITFQIGVANYGAIYGSFAALPLFLAWLQLSWLIVLFGAEVSFAHQNVAAYEFEPDSLKVSHSFRRITALLMISFCVKKFRNAEMPPTADDIARELTLPIRLVRSLLSELTEARLLSEVCLDQRAHIAYQPACDIDRLTVAAIMARLDQRGDDTIPIGDSISLTKLRETLRRFSEMNEQSSVNLKLEELCEAAQPKQLVT
jgi:membrane protein